MSKQRRYISKDDSELDNYEGGVEEESEEDSPDPKNAQNKCSKMRNTWVNGVKNWLQDFNHNSQQGKK